MVSKDLPKRYEINNRKCKKDTENQEHKVLRTRKWIVIYDWKFVYRREHEFIRNPTSNHAAAHIQF